MKRPKPTRRRSESSNRVGGARSLEELAERDQAWLEEVVESQAQALSDLLDQLAAADLETIAWLEKQAERDRQALSDLLSWLEEPERDTWLEKLED
ncbi:MAG TPA: hypothetical protein VGO93_23670 [Candidatus Xenobia bacterium]|jgi:hypothetical protein